MQQSIKSILNNDGRKGVARNLPESEYRSIGRLNASSLAAGIVDHNETDPTRVKFAFESRDPPRTAATQDRLDRGTLAHLMLLQPERLAEGVAIWHGGRRDGAEWTRFAEANQSRLIVRAEDYESVSDACREFRAVRMLATLLTEIDVEVSVFSNESELFTKGRLDAVKRGDFCAIIDLKTTEAGISQRSVERTIRDYHYREKMGFYRRMYQRELGRKVDACYNIFLSMIKPYAVRVERFSEHALDWGESRMMECLDGVRRCVHDDYWPMYAKDGVVVVNEWEIRDETQLEGFGDDD